MTAVDEAPEPLGRRERKKLATRRAIRDAALALALEHGVENLTVAEISEAADIAPRTFFNYFSCKEDALVTDGARTSAEMRELIAARPADEAPLRTLHAVITRGQSFAAMAADREQSLQRQRLIHEHSSLLARHLAQFAMIERALAEALADRRGVDPDVELRPAILAAVAVGVVRVAIRRWAADGSNSLVDLIAEGFDLLGRDVMSGSADAHEV